MVTRATLVCATLLILAVDVPAQSAKDAELKKLEQVVEQLASRFILEHQFAKFEGSAIGIAAERTDWPLHWRLAYALNSAYGDVAKDPDFKKLLAVKLATELQENNASLRLDGFMVNYTKAKARHAQIMAGVKLARENKVKEEININTAFADPAQAANIVQIISMVESATSKELNESRKKVTDALRKAVRDDPASLKILVEAMATAEKAETADLRKSRARLTESIKKAKKQ